VKKSVLLNKGPYLFLMLCFFLIVPNAFGQWTGKVILGDTLVGQPGFAPYNGQLFLAWAGTNGSHTINVMSSWDGLNYGNKVTLGSFTSPYSFGPSLSAVPGCGSLDLSYVGGGHNVNVSHSYDGVNWSGQTPLSSFSNATAVINGGEWPYGGVAFADGARVPHVYFFNNCNHNTFITSCFFFSGSCADASLRLRGAPAWSQDDSLRGITDNSNGGIFFGNNSGWSSNGGASNYGPSTAVDMTYGNHYIAWSGFLGSIYIQNVNTGALVTSSDWTQDTPVLAIFQDQIFLAWRGGGNNINVAKMDLF
jgi:hypothetical protein